MDDVERVPVDVAGSTEGVSLESKPPAAWIASIGEPTVNVELRFWRQYADRHVVRSAVSHRVLDAFSDAGLVMPYPASDVIVSKSVDEE